MKEKDSDDYGDYLYIDKHNKIHKKPPKGYPAWNPPPIVDGEGASLEDGTLVKNQPEKKVK